MVNRRQFIGIGQKSLSNKPMYSVQLFVNLHIHVAVFLYIAICPMLTTAISWNEYSSILSNLYA